MKYKVDPTWSADQRIDAALDIDSPAMRYQHVDTTYGRKILFVMSDSPGCAKHIYEAIYIDLWAQQLADSRGLCAMLYQAPKRTVCHISKVYDGVVGVFNTDTGFRRGPRSIANTAAHEAMHAARVLAAKDLELPINDAVLTREYEEKIAQWTGKLTVEFLNALRMLSV